MFELVRLSLEAYMLPENARVTATGDPVLLSAREASIMCMVLNELATNAAKYGALSVPQGRVTIRWSLKPGEEPSTNDVVMEWLERDGPPVEPPLRRGMGTQLIEESVSYELRGTVQTEYLPSGVRCSMTFPLMPEHVMSIASID